MTSKQQIITFQLIENNSYCSKFLCKERKIVSDKFPKYYKVYSNKKLTKIIFIFFENEFSQQLDLYEYIYLSNE